MKRDSHPLCSVDIFGVTYSSLLLKMHDICFFLHHLHAKFFIAYIYIYNNSQSILSVYIYQYCMLHLINYSLHNGAADNST